MRNGIFAGEKKSDASGLFGFSQSLLRQIIADVVATGGRAHVGRRGRVVEIHLVETTEDDEDSNAQRFDPEDSTHPAVKPLAAD